MNFTFTGLNFDSLFWAAFGFAFIYVYEFIYSLFIMIFVLNESWGNIAMLSNSP